MRSIVRGIPGPREFLKTLWASRQTGCEYGDIRLASEATLERESGAEFDIASQLRFGFRGVNFPK